MEENNNNLFIFSFKCLLFCLFFLSITTVFIIPYVPDIGKEQKYVYSLNKLAENNNKENYDIAFFGNSYSFTAYDPTIIKNELGLTALHINSSAQRLLTSLVVAKDLISKNAFKYIVFDVSDQTVRIPKNDEKAIWNYQTIALQETPFSLNKMTFLSRFFPNDLYTEYYISALSKKAGRFFRMNDLSNYEVRRNDFSFIPKSSSTLFSFNGFLAKKHLSITKEAFMIEKNRNSSKRIPADSLWNDDLKNLMQDLILISNKKKIKILLVNSLKLHNQNFKDEYLDSIVNSNSNVRFLNLNEKRDKYSLNEKDFYNSTHLNFSGSFKVSHRLVDSLLSFYKLDKKTKPQWDLKYLKTKDIFYNLNANEDKFIKLEFDKIPKLLNGHQLVISIYPKDTALLSDYSKKKKFGSDNFYVQQPADNNIDVGNSKIIISKLKTKITEENLKKIAIYFYKPKDALGMPTINIFKD